MSELLQIKEKKALRKREGRHISLPKATWKKLEENGKASGLSLVDLVEFAVDGLLARLDSPDDVRGRDVQEPCQTAGV